MADTTDWSSILGTSKERSQRQTAQGKARQAAEVSPKSIILTPKELQTGHWDAAKILQTTLGGTKRDITADDLIAFKQNVTNAQNKHLIKGITPQQVINFSTAKDRERTSQAYKLAGKTIKPINHAVPLAAKNGVIRFMTDAGGSTKGVLRHYVDVQFINYPSYASSPTDSLKAAKLLVKDAIKFDCDCGRHQFWYRYIATIGNFAYGRAEHGYPKIRNPQLDGIACKHVLRAMHELLKSYAVQNYIAKHIEKAQANLLKTAEKRQSQKAVDALIKAQARRKTGHILKTTTAEKAKRVVQVAPKPERPAKASRAIQQTDSLASKIAATHAALTAINAPQAVIDAAIHALNTQG